MKKVLWFPIMIMAIPLDIIFWNLIFGAEYGFRSPMQCLKENWEQWCDLGKDAPTEANEVA